MNSTTTSDVSLTIRSAMKVKLAELGNDVYDELPDYIMVMIANRRNEANMRDDLELFLGDNTDHFTSWLQNLLSNLISVGVLHFKHTGVFSNSQSRVMVSSANTNKIDDDIFTDVNVSSDNIGAILNSDTATDLTLSNTVESSKDIVYDACSMTQQDTTGITKSSDACIEKCPDHSSLLEDKLEKCTMKINMEENCETSNFRPTNFCINSNEYKESTGSDESLDYNDDEICSGQTSVNTEKTDSSSDGDSESIRSKSEIENLHETTNCSNNSSDSEMFKVRNNSFDRNITTPDNDKVDYGHMSDGEFFVESGPNMELQHDLFSSSKVTNINDSHNCKSTINTIPNNDNMKDDSNNSNVDDHSAHICSDQLPDKLQIETNSNSDFDDSMELQNATNATLCGEIEKCDTDGERSEPVYKAAKFDDNAMHTDGFNKESKNRVSESNNTCEEQHFVETRLIRIRRKKSAHIGEIDTFEEQNFKQESTIHDSDKQIINKENKINTRSKCLIDKFDDNVNYEMDNDSHDRGSNTERIKTKVIRMKNHAVSGESQFSDSSDDYHLEDKTETRIVRVKVRPKVQTDYVKSEKALKHDSSIRLIRDIDVPWNQSLTHGSNFVNVSSQCRTECDTVFRDTSERKIMRIHSPRPKTMNDENLTKPSAKRKIIIKRA